MTYLIFVASATLGVVLMCLGDFTGLAFLFIAALIVSHKA